MLKKEVFVSLIIIIGYLICCFYIDNININTSSIFTNNLLLKGNKPSEIPLARLQINRLNIDKYIYKIDSKANNVDKNVSILKESILPDQDNSIIFLAAHSGDSKVSYFENLKKLKKGEEISFYYNNHNYIYKVIDIYEMNKDGYIGVNKRKDKQLILTTCSPTHKNKQLIIDSILIK